MLSLDTIRRNPSSSIVAFFSFCALLIPFVDQFRDATAPFRIDARVWLWTSAVLGGAVVVGQMYQAIRPTVPVSWGLPSIIGFLGSAGALITPLVADLAGTLAPLNVPNDVWVKIGSGLAVLTLFGRIHQATGSNHQPPVIIPEDVPGTGGAGEPTG